MGLSLQLLSRAFAQIEKSGDPKAKPLSPWAPLCTHPSDAIRYPDMLRNVRELSLQLEGREVAQKGVVAIQQRGPILHGPPFCTPFNQLTCDSALE